MSNLPHDMKVFGPVDPPPSPTEWQRNDWKSDPRVQGNITDPVQPVQQSKRPVPNIGEVCDAMDTLNRLAEEFPVLFVKIAKQEKFAEVLRNPMAQ